MCLRVLCRSIEVGGGRYKRGSMSACRRLCALNLRTRRPAAFSTLSSRPWAVTAIDFQGRRGQTRIAGSTGLSGPASTMSGSGALLPPPRHRRPPVPPLSHCSPLCRSSEPRSSHVTKKNFHSQPSTRRECSNTVTPTAKIPHPQWHVHHLMRSAH